MIIADFVPSSVRCDLRRWLCMCDVDFDALTRSRALSCAQVRSTGAAACTPQVHPRTDGRGMTSCWQGVRSRDRHVKRTLLA